MDFWGGIFLWFYFFFPSPSLFLRERERGGGRGRGERERERKKEREKEREKRGEEKQIQKIHKTKGRVKEILLLLLCEKKSQPRWPGCLHLTSCLHRSRSCPFWLAPLPKGRLPNVNFFLFENINNYYFVLCGISGLLFHSLGLSLGSEMLACEILKPWFDLHRAGIMFRMSKKR